MNDPKLIPSLLTSTKTIAVVGLSDNPAKPSHYVSAYMQQHSYRILPVNPALAHVLGEPAHASLTALVQSGITPDLVNVFRLPSFLPGIVDEMLSLGLGRLWVQQGIVHPEAAAHAEANGIRVVMDRCIMIEHRQIQVEHRRTHLA
ncbi:MAG TPA: CoA-binding protein [Granulicella sp.]|nr:CoA-binding protein [Granulicella sp.]